MFPYHIIRVKSGHSYITIGSSRLLAGLVAPCASNCLKKIMNQNAGNIQWNCSLWWVMYWGDSQKWGEVVGSMSFLATGNLSGAHSPTRGCQVEIGSMLA
jgi:hypothetical protein